MTIVGITKNLKFEVHFGGIAKDPWGIEKAGFTLTARISRNDWKLHGNTVTEAGGLLVGEEILISCEDELANAGQKDLILELDSTVPQKAKF